MSFLFGAFVGITLTFAFFPVPNRQIAECHREARRTQDWDTMTDCLTARYGWTLERANDATTAMSYFQHPAQPAGDPMGQRRPVEYQ